MDLFGTFLNSLVSGAIAFYNSAFFSFIKFLIGIYTAVILVDIVLLLIQRGLSGNYRETIFGIDIPDELVKPKRKNRLKLKWEQIRRRIDSENESDYKVAIVSADNLIDDLLRRMGYKGENMDERLENINPGQIENLEDLKRAHAVKNRIIHEEGFKINKQEAQEVILVYEEFLRLFEILD